MHKADEPPKRFKKTQEEIRLLRSISSIRESIFNLFCEFAEPLSCNDPFACGAINNGGWDHAADSAVNHKINLILKVFKDHFGVCVVFHHIAGQGCTEDRVV